MSGTIYLIRHGQSAVNLAAQGCPEMYYSPDFLDSKLSEAGKAQAAGLKERLGDGFHADLVLTSTLHRALATATIGLEAQIDQARDVGDGNVERDSNTTWIAMDSLNESDEEFPPREAPHAGVSKPCNHRRSLSADEKLKEFAHVDFTKYCSDADLMGSESHEELEDRVKLFARELAEIMKTRGPVRAAKRLKIGENNHEQQRAHVNVVLVAHFVLLYKLLSMLEGYSPPFDLPNCAVKTVPLQKVLALAA